jgi:hypothetical protein
MHLHVKVAYLESDDADQNPEDEEEERDDEPDDPPHFCFCKLVLAVSTYSPIYGDTRLTLGRETATDLREG